VQIWSLLELLVIFSSLQYVPDTKFAVKRIFQSEFGTAQIYCICKLQGCAQNQIVHFDIRNIWQIRIKRYNASAGRLPPAAMLKRWPRVCRRSRLHWYQTICSVPQERIRWNGLYTGFHWESAFVRKISVRFFWRFVLFQLDGQKNSRPHGRESARRGLPQPAHGIYQ